MQHFRSRELAHIAKVGEVWMTVTKDLRRECGYGLKVLNKNKKSTLTISFNI